MTSDLIKFNLVIEAFTQPHLKHSWKAACLEGEQFRVLSQDTITAQTVRYLIDGPYIIRMDLPSHERVYFVGNDEAYFCLQGQGKTVLWISQLFEEIRKYLIKLGFPEEYSPKILGWSVSTIFKNIWALEVFPGSKVEVRE